MYVRMHLRDVEDVPDLHLRVHPRGEQQVARPREPSDRGDALGVPRPRVHPLLRDVALVLVLAARRRAGAATSAPGSRASCRRGTPTLLHRLALLGVARLPLLALGLRLRLDRRRLLGGELRLLVRDRLVRRVEAEPLPLLLELRLDRRLPREDRAAARASAHLSASPTMPSCRAICGPPPSLCPASPPVLGSIAKPYALNVWYCSSNAKSDDGWYCAAAPRKCCFDLIPAERCCPCVRLGPCSGAHIVSYSGLA